MNELDIKTGVYSITRTGNKFQMMLATGSSLNIKPELVFKALYSEFGIDADNSEDIYYNVHRFDIFSSVDPLKTLTQGVS